MAVSEVLPSLQRRPSPLPGGRFSEEDPLPPSETLAVCSSEQVFSLPLLMADGNAVA